MLRSRSRRSPRASQRRRNSTRAPPGRLGSGSPFRSRSAIPPAGGRRSLRRRRTDSSAPRSGSRDRGQGTWRVRGHLAHGRARVRNRLVDVVACSPQAEAGAQQRRRRLCASACVRPSLPAAMTAFRMARSAALVEVALASHELEAKQVRHAGVVQVERAVALAAGATSRASFSDRSDVRARRASRRARRATAERQRSD